MATVYKQFRGVDEFYGGKIAERFSFSKRFDEPTYFSFKLVFGDTIDQAYNKADLKSNYDVMPQPLFNRLYERERDVPVQNLKSYSAIRYLADSNEPTRAAMLQEFIDKFDYLQNNFPYYFQQIDGVSELLKIDPTKGQRITSDKKLTITCLEGLDLRMSYLLNLYRKVAWDDVYQRWVLPDMMRYFSLKIYLSEFRVFHLPGELNAYGGSPFQAGAPALPVSSTLNPNQLVGSAGRIQQATQPQENTPTSQPELILNVMDSVLPTWEINCEMCEFDITDINFDHLTGLNVAADPVQGAVKFGIKIGNVKELQTYPVFQNMFLSDRKLNGRNRASEEISTQSDANNRYLYPASLLIAQNREGGEVNSHESGKPFNERTNQNNTTKGAYPAQPANTLSKATEGESGTGQRETWAGNALNFGEAYLKNTVETVIDKAKTTPIPGLGSSFTEIQGAIQSKNIIDVLGLIRKSMTTVANEYVMPSERLSEQITDGSFRQVLMNLSKSTATDPTSRMLAEAANIALSDRGVWEKIKDYSLATNMTGPKESNTNKTLNGTEQYTEAANVGQGFKERVEGGNGIKSIDPNAASLGRIEQERLQRIAASGNLGSQTSGDGIVRETASSRLASSTEGGTLNRGSASEQLTDQNLSGGVSQGKPSSNLTSNVQVTPGITQGPSGLKNTVIQNGTIIEGKPSSQLKSNTENEPLPQPPVSKATNSKLEQ